MSSPAETIACPKHGVRPAVADPFAGAPGYTMCRGCWYLQWLQAVLGWTRRSRR